MKKLIVLIMLSSTALANDEKQIERDMQLVSAAFECSHLYSWSKKKGHKEESRRLFDLAVKNGVITAKNAFEKFRNDKDIHEVFRNSDMFVGFYLGMESEKARAKATKKALDNSKGDDLLIDINVSLETNKMNCKVLR